MIKRGIVIHTKQNYLFNNVMLDMCCILIITIVIVSLHKILLRRKLHELIDSNVDLLFSSLIFIKILDFLLNVSILFLITGLH